MEVNLPTEVWLFVCEQLEKQREFGALFNCTLVSKTLAGPAVRSLYRIHSLSPVINEGTEIEVSKAGGVGALDMRKQYDLQVLAISKWALQWRSIIMSSLGKTSYPYCLYIKSLDLRNLAQVFENGIFRDNVQDSFFTDEISALITSINSTHTKKFGKQSTRRQNLKYNANLSRDVIGESITKYVYQEAQTKNSVAALEEISGEIPRNLLFSCCSRLARLKTITLWEGKSLDKEIAEQIKANCPDFESLTIFSHLGNAADDSLAEFFHNLRPNSLRYFEMIHSNDIHQATFKALSTHAQSLLELKLSSLKSNAIRCLGFLKDCKSLTTLAIQDREGRIDLEATENDVFLDIVLWLKGCRDLKNLTIDNIVSGTAIASPVLLDKDIKLRKFEMLKHLTDDLLDAVSRHNSLEELKLRGDAPSRFAGTNHLVDRMCALENLKVLDLLGISDNFRDAHIKKICEHLHKIHELSLSGDNLTSLTLPSLLQLPHLHHLFFNALTRFTYPALLSYIQALNPITNHGLVLLIMSQASECRIEEEEQVVLRREIAARVGGRLELELERDDVGEGFEGYESGMGGLDDD